MNMKKLKKELETASVLASTEEESKLIRDWLDYDGSNTPFIITEELGELISAINKHVARPGENTLLHVAEELADTQIVIEFCKLYFDIPEETLAKIRSIKLTKPIPEDDDVSYEFKRLAARFGPICDEIDSIIEDTTCPECGPITIDSLIYRGEPGAACEPLKELSNRCICLFNDIEKFIAGCKYAEELHSTYSFLSKIFNKIRHSSIDFILWSFPSTYDEQPLYTNIFLLTHELTRWATICANPTNNQIQ